ncbi:MAG: NAD(P)/FAD-dependent oxidoreductase [Nanobdellota archaeon]
MKVVIIGGGSAGSTCAFEIRKLDKNAEITILEKTGHTEYSPCALPYVISGEINDFKDIFIFNDDDYKKNNITINLNSKVKKIDRTKKIITYTKQEEIKEIRFDKLVLATGSSSFAPPIEGLSDSDYYSFKTIDDAKSILNSIKKENKSVVIGGGLIGIELAHSLAVKREQVTLIEVKENILPGLLDKKMSEKLKEHLGKIQIYEERQVEKITNNNVIVENEKISFDKLLLCTGIKPNIKIAKQSGLETDKGIVVNEFMQSSDKDIYACGDCAESTELNSGQKILSALGTTATRQAKVIAQNILGGKKESPHVMNNSISKVGEVYVGSVGLSEKRAKELNLNIVSATYTGTARAEYYDSKKKITIKLIAKDSGKIIGGQIVGNAEVVGRLNLIALAISKEMQAKDIAELETCYNPPAAPIFDPLTIAARILIKKCNILRGKQ